MLRMKSRRRRLHRNITVLAVGVLAARTPLRPSKFNLVDAFAPTRQPALSYQKNVQHISLGVSGEGIGVGIDLGTTFSAISILGDDEKPQIIPIPKNGRTMPSVVAFDEDSNPLVGREALEWEEVHQTSAYRHVKRIIGTGAEHVSVDTAKVVPHLAPNLLEESAGSKGKKRKKKKKASLEKQLKDAEQNPAMLMYANDPSHSSTVSPITISSLVVQKLLDTAKAATSKEITRAVVGVPAYFNDAQREATTQAVQMAGIPKVKLLREPEAVSHFFGTPNNSYLCLDGVSNLTLYLLLNQPKGRTCIRG